MSQEQPFILVSDDDVDLRTIISVKLEAAGMRVVQAENGQDAIDKCKAEKPDLIIMDVRMPVMTGTEAVSAIKADPQLKDIKIIFLSNFGEEKEIDAWMDQKYAKEMGAIGYIKKSEDLDAIIAKVKELLAQAPTTP